jgi:hypothetical protein
MREYGRSVEDFTKGDHIEIHPATDAWHAGYRLGIVEACTTDKKVLVIMNNPPHPLFCIAPQNLRKIDK